MTDYDSLELGEYYSEKYLKLSGEIKNSRSVGKLYDLVLSPDKAATDPDVKHWEVGEDNSYVCRVVEKGRGAQDVSIQDQVTSPVIAKFNYVNGFSLSTVAVETDERIISVEDSTAFTVGDYIIIYSDLEGKFYLGNLLSISGNDLELDTPFDCGLAAGVIVKSTTTNMNVDGSDNVVAYGLRGVSSEYPFDVTFDVTRIIFNCETSFACDLSTFGDIAALTRGLVLRRKDGTCQNIFNVKSNAEMAGIMYDFTIEQSTNPAQGQDGFYGRLTFAGQSKLGVALRLASGEDLEFLIQDDLTDITKLEVVAEGHVVDYGIY